MKRILKKYILTFCLISGLECATFRYKLEYLLSCDIISVIHTYRIYLSPFTKDIRVWVTLKRSRQFHL